LKSEEKQTFDV